MKFFAVSYDIIHMEASVNANNLLNAPTAGKAWATIRLQKRETKIPDLPLACYPGEHPKGTSYMPGNCSEEEVLADYKRAIQKYTDECADPKNYVSEKCQDKRATFPVGVHELEVLTSGPLARIIPHLDIGGAFSGDRGIDDFRSGAVMRDAMHNPQIKVLMQQKRKINILYPGGGSHMTPLVFAFDGIDNGWLDSAELVYTEIEPKTEKTTRDYLNWFYNNGVISDLTDETISSNDSPQSHTTKFSFKYEGKPITLAFTLNCGAELWATDDQIRNSDLIIIHDSLYNHNDKDYKNNMADRFIEKTIELSGGQRRFFLSEDFWENLRTPPKHFAYNPNPYTNPYARTLPDWPPPPHIFNPSFLSGGKVSIVRYEGAFGCSGVHLQALEHVLQEGRLITNPDWIVFTHVPMESSKHAVLLIYPAVE